MTDKPTIDLGKLQARLGPGFGNLALRHVGPNDPGKLSPGDWVTGQWSLNLDFSLRVDGNMSAATASAFLHEQFRSRVWSNPKLEHLLANTTVDYLDILRYANHVTPAEAAVLHDLVNAIVNGSVAKQRHAIRKQETPPQARGPEHAGPRIFRVDHSS
jgi:hypothetical protein